MILCRMSKMPLICEYEDLYKYLADYYSYRKHLDKQFNYELWSAELGYKSASYVKMVVGSHRAPTRELFQKFTNKVSLSFQEKKHFIVLMLKSRSALSAESEFIQDHLLETLKNPIEVSIEEKETGAFLNHLQMPVIQLLRSFKDAYFSDDELVDLLSISPADAKNIFENSSNQRRRGSFKVEPKNKSFELKKFHLETLKEAEMKIKEHPESANFQAIYFSMSEERQAEMQTEVQEFLNKMKLKYGDDKLSENRVYKMNLNVYPVTPKFEVSKADLGESPAS